MTRSGRTRTAGGGALWVLIASALVLGVVAYLYTAGVADHRRADEPTDRQAQSDAAVGRAEPSRRDTRGKGTARPSEIASGAAADRGPAIKPKLAVIERDAGLQFGALRGYVVNRSTLGAIPGAEIAFVLEGRLVSVVSDAAGRFELVASSAGPYALAMVTAEGYLPFAPELGLSASVFRPRPQSRIAETTFYLSPAVEYQGQVIDPNGNGIAGASIRMLGATEGERSLVGLEDRFVSSTEGRFQFHAPDGARFEATHPDWAPGRAVLDGAAQVSHTLKIRLGREPPEAYVQIAGRVVDDEGVSIEGAEVWADVQRADAWSLAPRASSDATGAFVLDDVERGLEYRVSASAQGYNLSTVRDIAGGANEVELVLTKGGVIRGAVVDDATGEPVAAATVAALAPRDSLALTVFKRQSFFDARGEYELRGLPVGTYTVVVVARGYASARNETVLVQGIDTPGLANFRLSGGGIVEGKVIDAQSRAPLPLARVSIESSGLAGLESAVPSVLEDITDRAGLFSITGVEPGRHSVRAVAFKRRARVLSGVEVDSGQTSASLLFELSEVQDGEPEGFDIVGIGVVLRAAAQSLVVLRVVEGGGAEGAGVLADDEILAVDGEAVTQLGFQNAIQNLRGKAGTQVRLTIRRAGERELDLEATRSRVQG